MIAKDCGRRTGRALIALAALGSFGPPAAWAQQDRAGRGEAAPAPAPAGRPTPADAPVIKPVVLPANPNDPVAIINNQVISRRQLADECVARRGKEILDTLIARSLMEQALQAHKLEVTAAEIDAEIDKTALSLSGLGREAWLRSLEKERGISPVQYARDIIYPTIAMRKLATPLVQVTPKDMTEGFEAHFGERLKVRVIMVDKLRAAQEIWEQLKNNPGGFEKIAQTQSIDKNSGSMGGIVPQPITRHADPREFSDAVFLQLVGNPKDKDPSHQPKDGDFTGPVQYSEGVWAIVRREGVIAAQPADPNDPKVRAMLRELIFEAKVKAKMGDVFQQLYQAAKIENVLTGQTKMAHEELDPRHRVAESEAKLMEPKLGAIGASKPKDAAVEAASATGPKMTKAPAGVSAEAAKRIEAMKRPLKTSGPAKETSPAKESTTPTP